MKIAFTSIISLLLMVACASTSQMSPQPIKNDPDWISNQLPNGLKYHIYHDGKSPVSIRFIVHTGSINETINQQGYAHFLEHMAFNGSQHFKENQIIKDFEKAGASFGADINASTDYVQTTYKLDLPNQDTLDQGMLWFRDIADGLTISETEVEKEKGVILGEYRLRRPEHKPFYFSLYNHLITDTALAQHDPLGTKASIQATTAQGLKQFYRTWYQPQRTEIIISGNLSTSDADALISKHFSNWASTTTESDAKAEAIVNIDDLHYNNQNFVAPIGPYDSASFGLLIPRGKSRWVTLGDQTFYWRDDVAYQLIYQRLNSTFIDHGLAIQQTYTGDYWLEGQRYSQIQVSFAEQDRQEIQAQLISVITSLRDHGVSQTELNNIMSGYQQTLDTADQNWEKQTATEHANGMAHSIRMNQMPQSKADYKNNLTLFIANTDVSVINTHLDQLLAQPKILTIGASKTENVTALNATLPTLTSQLAQAGEKPLFTESDKDFNQPKTIGTITHERIDPQNPNMTIWTLSNGLEVWYLRDRNAGKEVNIAYSGLGGKAALPPELFPTFEVFIPTIIRSGIGQLNGSQLQYKLRSRNIAVSPYSTYTCQGITISTPQDSLADSFATLYTALTDIRVSDVQLKAVKQQSIQAKKIMFQSPAGLFDIEFENHVFPKESYRHLVSFEDISTITAEQIKQTHQILFTQNRNNKLVIIADLDKKQLAPLLRQYAANFPLEPSKDVSYNPNYNQHSRLLTIAPYNNENSSLVLLRTLSNQPLARSTKDIFINDMLSRIIKQRLTQSLREDLSLDYSPNVLAFFADEEQYQDWAFLVWAAPKQVTNIQQAFKDVIEQLHQGITTQETSSVGKQLAADLAPLVADQKQYTAFIQRYLIHGYDFHVLQDPNSFIQTISASDLSQAFEQQFGEGSLSLEALLTPKK
ncbi:hypothetical protein A1QC_08330 [Vibrio rumoiensis 1S-45]|uniref:Peptidase M16 n=1 Tax=Vibrio rumoiensis 1S-45 TaxID=1188252 RepID=A0A1E5E2N8_9VIBR|nr:hypothetical protein A1QC_08330 [Vibrio rumoiensis 1S-45]